ncbi:hypothetical protein LCGC14_1865460 [marine sediment metagenome]|uniref:Uncharacterized protein n=1 Tax=marine sediment metagenome TaxID=412755 RepID=A0A0F9G6F6_9ZZZZ
MSWSDNYIIREGDTLCSPGLTHRYKVVEIIDGAVKLRLDDGSERTIPAQRMHCIIHEGVLMLLQHAEA